MSYHNLNFKHDQPSRLLTLTHPAWTVYRNVSSLLPLWQQYLDEAKTDEQVALLIVDCVSRGVYKKEVPKKVKENMDVYLDWFDKLKEDYKDRIAIWATKGQESIHTGLLRPDENQYHFDWLHDQLNIKPNSLKLPFPIFGRTHSSFYKIDYHGIGMDSCVWTQMEHLRKLTYLEDSWDLRNYDNKTLNSIIND